MSRAEEERRISRENEARRMSEIERLRKEKDETLVAKDNLKDEIADLRRQLTVSVSAGGISALSSKSYATPDVEVPNNVKRLRNELAMARARLTDARDHSQRSCSGMNQFSRSESTDQSVTPPPDSPDKSVDSAGSSWVPPSMNLESWWSPPVKKSTDPPTPPPQTVTTDRVAAPVTPLKEPVQVATRVSTAPVAVVSTSKKSDVSDLQRQLDASSKRLQEANTKLKGLVEKSTLSKNTAFQSRSHHALLTIVRANSKDGSNSSGVIDEVLTSDSGSIEVNHVRYVDI
jgi:hypothetical protein